MEHLFPYPKMGHSFLEILYDPLTRKLLGFDAVHAEKTPFISGVSSRLAFLLQDAMKHLSFLKIGYTALEAFLQANCTGPPLPFNPEESVFPDTYRDEHLPELKQELLQYLSVDGSAAHPLIPHIELFWLAKLVMSNSTLAEAGFNGRRARYRVNFWHQKLLNEKSDKLQDILYTDADILEHQLSSRLTFGGAAAEEHFVEFLVERAQGRIYYGDDEKAREDLTRASKTRHFQFALTGALGKRTKFQVNDLSQLVVLARSRDHEPEPYSSRKSSRAGSIDSRKASKDESVSPPPRSPSLTLNTHQFPWRSGPTSPRVDHHVSPLAAGPMKPETVSLNDDTLLEHIKFKTTPPFEPEMTKAIDSDALPPRLAELDLSNQPLLFPMDSIILLATASSIQNTSPSDGLTREETLPYAERVLQGGSSNWQVYTQALLVRSRIEGYKSRTAERGLLQLQACVDQVIAETTGTHAPEKANGNDGEPTSAPATFLPKAVAAESASVAERLKFIYQLSSPLRWELEAELASRWTSMGGLKTALEIYERLQMYAEVALCLGATGQEPKATEMLKQLLFEPLQEGAGDEVTTLKLKSPMPSDAPRLLCILGDTTGSAAYYELAWTASGKTYGRAQRSLGRSHVKKREYKKAIAAYKLALQRGRLDHATWFALGCVQLELTDWKGAVESFNRCVMIDEQDAQGWSNLAIALLRLPVEETLQPSSTAVSSTSTSQASTPPEGVDEGEPVSSLLDPYKNKRAALRALRRAATIKRDDSRIWDNYLTVAASIPPSQGTPWADIIQAMGRIIDLRGSKEGESCIDLKILVALVEHVTNNFEFPTTANLEEQEDGDAHHEITKIEEEPGVGPTEQNPDAPMPEQQSKSATLPFIPRALLGIVDKQLTPLATASVPLIKTLASVASWRQRPAEALALYEKAWRVSTSTPGVYESEKGWDDVAAATEELVGKYKELGEMQRERTGGKAEANWRFKAKTAVRGVLGRGREMWAETESWKVLEEVGGKELK